MVGIQMSLFASKNMSRSPRSARKKITTFFLLILAGTMALGLSGCSNSNQLPNQQVTTMRGGTYTPSGKPAAGATVVTVGMYAVNAYDIDTAANTFQFKGYIWLRWKGDYDAVSSLEFANSVEEWGLTVTNLTDKPQSLPGGYHLQQIRVQGRFFEPFNLANYPLDKQHLQVTLENLNDPINKVVYVPDVANTTYDSKFKVPGWDITGMSAESLDHNYVSNFGDPTTPDGSKYSALTFSINIQRTQNLFWLKLLLPLMLVLITNWLSLLLNPKYTEIRTAMPATALLTTVFLQQSSLDAIPQVSSLVLMDLVYVVAYSTIVLTFAQIIWDNHKIKNEEPDVMHRVARTDRRSLVIQAVLTFAVIAILVVTHN